MWSCTDLNIEVVYARTQLSDKLCLVTPKELNFNSKSMAYKSNMNACIHNLNIKKLTHHMLAISSPLLTAIVETTSQNVFNAK